NATEGGTITAYASNNLNQYTAVGEFTPSFDADGNQTLVKTSTGIWAVQYNAENRPVSFTNSASNTVVECTYDSMGRRATKKVTTNGSVTSYLRYIYRGYLQIAAIDAISGTFQWFLVWDPTQRIATRPLAIRKDGTWFAYGWDLTKNICEVFGPAGYIRTSYTYTPYGTVTSSGDVTQPIQWSSECHDEELGLVYYNCRHYNPLDGRWTGRDIILSNNEYCYVRNQVQTHIDVYGKFAATLAAPALLGTGALLPVLGIVAGAVVVGAVVIYAASVAADVYDTWEREAELEETRKKRCSELRAKKQEFAKHGIKGATCKGLKASKCPDASACQVLADKIKKFKEAIKIRDEYDRVCFDGGDSGHNKQITALNKGLAICRKYYEDCIMKLNRK
ncbi:MAG: RHS repeat-associated core domain-containing protein, partial [Akkermansia sp.]